MGSLFSAPKVSTPPAPPPPSTAAAKSFSSSINSDATRQASLLDYYEKTMPASGYSVFDSALQKGVGTSVAESIFDVPGSLLGSLFGG